MNCRNGLGKERHKAQTKGSAWFPPWFVKGTSSKT